MSGFKPEDRVILEFDLSHFTVEECLDLMVAVARRGVRQCIIRNFGHLTNLEELIGQFKAAGASMVLVNADDVENAEAIPRLIKAGVDFVITGDRIMREHPRKKEVALVVREVAEGFKE